MHSVGMTLFWVLLALGAIALLWGFLNGANDAFDEDPNNWIPRRNFSASKH